MTLPARRIVKSLIDRMHVVCWPVYGSGNALMRCLTAHNAYSYNPDWNMWGPLEWVLQPPIERAYQFKAHLGDIWGEHRLTLQDSFEDQLVNQLSHKQLTDREMAWLHDVHHNNLSVVYGAPNHIPACQMTYLTSRPIVQLVPRNIAQLLKRAKIDEAWKQSVIHEKHDMSVLGHQTPHLVNSPQVLNIYIEDLFYSNYATFLQTYSLLRSHFSLEDRSEQIWAFVLYYQDRIKRDANEQS